MEAAKLLGMTVLDRRQKLRHSLSIQEIRRVSEQTAFARHQCAIEIYWDEHTSRRGFVYQKEADHTDEGNGQPWYFASEGQEICLTEPNGAEQVIPERLNGASFEVLSDAIALEMETRIRVDSVPIGDPQKELWDEMRNHCTEEKLSIRRRELHRLSEIQNLKDLFSFATAYQSFVIQRVHLSEFSLTREATSAYDLLTRCPKSLRIATMAALLKERLNQERARLSGQELPTPCLEEILENGAKFFEILRRLRDFLHKNYSFRRVPGNFGSDSAIFEDIISDSQSLAEITLALMSKENIDGLLSAHSGEHESVREDTQGEVIRQMLESNEIDLEASGINVSEMETAPIRRILEALDKPPSQRPALFPHELEKKQVAA